MRRGTAVLVAVLAAPLLGASSGEAADAARAAAEDPAALDRVLAIADIDGSPVDMASLVGTEPGRAERLTALATLLDPEDAGEPIEPHRVAAEVRDILSDPIYADTRETLLERLLGPVYDWFERMTARVWDLGLRFIGWLFSLFDLAVLAWLGPAILVVATAATTWILARRRAREVERRTAIERILELGTDPAELEGLARDADREGRYDEAIRLRFVSGLLRLDADGRIDFYPGLSNALISEALGDEGFDELSAQFDRVVYGRRQVGETDSRRSSHLWDRLLGVRA